MSAELGSSVLNFARLRLLACRFRRFRLDAGSLFIVLYAKHFEPT